MCRAACVEAVQHNKSIRTCYFTSLCVHAMISSYKFKNCKLSDMLKETAWRALLSVSFDVALADACKSIVSKRSVSWLGNECWHSKGNHMNLIRYFLHDNVLSRPNPKQELVLYREFKKKLPYCKHFEFPSVCLQYFQTFQTTTSNDGKL